MTEADVDMLHDVLHTSDWVFVDATGQKQPWSHMRERAVQALSAPRLDSMIQPIRKLSLGPDGATVVVNLSSVRTVVDDEGRDGK